MTKNRKKTKATNKVIPTMNELYRQQQNVQKQLEQELTRWEELSMQAEEQESKL